MTTMALAIRDYVESVGSRVTGDQIKRHINSEFPGQWKATTLQAHLYACVVNNPKAYIHHPSTEKFLFRNMDGSYEIYKENIHGANVWIPDAEEVEDFTADYDEITALESSITLERDIEEHLIRHLDAIEKGLKLISRQETTEVGRIDILAEDATGGLVVIELKAGDAKDSSVGKIARYMGWYAKQKGRMPRGILIAGGFPEGVIYAAATIQNLCLVKYQVHFSFEKQPDNNLP